MNQYNQMSLDQLQALLTERKIDFSADAVEADLIALLEAADAAATAGKDKSKGPKVLSIEELSKAVTAQNKTIAEQSKKIAELTKLVGSGKATAVVTEAAKKELPKLHDGEVENDKKVYRFTVPAFYLPGDSTKYTSAAAATDVELQNRILAIKGQRIMKEVV